MPRPRRSPSPARSGAGLRIVATSLGLIGLLAVPPATAATYVVDRTDDSTVNTCSVMPDNCALRGAILKANANPGADEIVLPPGTYLLSIDGTGEDLAATGDLDVRDELTIRGAGPELSVIDAGSVDRVFHVRAPGERLTLRGLQVRGGVCAPGDGGGGIRSQEGALRLETVWVVGNLCAGAGGAINAGGCTEVQRLEVVDSWIGDNDAGLYGGIYAGCPLTLEHSTVSANTGDSTAGGIGLIASSNLLRHSTIRDNNVLGDGYPGGVRLMANREASIDACTFSGNFGADLQIDSGGSVELLNTLIDGECGGVVPPSSIGGNLESPGHSCGLGASDLEDVVDPGLSALGWYGGPAPTMRPLAGSPALDQEIAGPNGSTLDQRRAPRPRDGDGDGGATHDIGAVELWGPGEIFLDGFECGFLTSWSLSAP